MEHLHLVPVENIPTPLWKLKHQSVDIHFHSMSTGCCLETLHIFALCLSCTVCHSLSKEKLCIPQNMTLLIILCLLSLSFWYARSNWERRPATFFQVQQKRLAFLMKNCPAAWPVSNINPWHLRGYVLQIIHFLTLNKSGNMRKYTLCVTHTPRYIKSSSRYIEHVHRHTRVKPGPWVWEHCVHAIYSVHVSCVTWITWPRYPWCIFSVLFPTKT